MSKAKPEHKTIMGISLSTYLSFAVKHNSFHQFLINLVQFPSTISISVQPLLPKCSQCHQAVVMALNITVKTILNNKLNDTHLKPNKYTVLTTHGSGQKFNLF